MKILVLGTPGSGKSEYAEKLIMQMADGRQKKYIATMIPFGEEGEARVLRHRNMREGKGFETIECPTHLESLCPELPDDCICLLECISNLVGNEMYSEENAASDEKKLYETIVSELKELFKLGCDFVIVSNEFEEKEEYDEKTREYIRLSRMVNEFLRGMVSEVHENF